MTEVLVWAVVLLNRGKPEVVEVYNTELVCRQEMREARKVYPQAELRCVPKWSAERPTE